MSLFRNLCINVALCFVVAKTILCVPKNEAGPLVQIKNGTTIIGKVGKTVDQNKMYYAFRGIPFAEPPIGALRFKPPLPISSKYSNQTMYAFRSGSPCVQSSLGDPIIGSEDCLYLDVYTPQFSHHDSLLPVMVYFYGGAWLNGDDKFTTYGPDYFLNEDVMIVIFNYRLGPFGFLSTEDQVAPGNYGIKDQLLALKWIQENIEYFGGSPNNVTAFGESSGAVCLSYLTQSPLAKGLFNRVILESGTTLNQWALVTNPKSTAIRIAQRLNVDTTTSKSLVDGLRKIDYRDLQKATAGVEITKLIFEDNMDTLPFAPSKEPPHPDAIVVNKSHVQLSSGLYSHVPYIIGFNSMEALPIIDEIYNTTPLYLLRYVLPTALVPKSMNINNFIIKFLVNCQIWLHYYGITHIVPIKESTTEFVSDNDFVRPILEATRLYSQMAPVYLYLFSYKGILGSGNTTALGVGHGEEVHYLWRQNLNAINEAAATPSDQLTRYRMIRLWTNFAKTGNPTFEKDALLQNITWPVTKVIEKASMAYLNIGEDLAPGVDPRWTTFVYWKDLFDRFGNPPYSTY